MKAERTTFIDTMTKVRLVTLSDAHNKLCSRVASKRGLTGVRAMEQRNTDALHKLMAAQLFAGEGKR